MKPNFALSLSFEGIRLLHRAPDGWRQVGEVAVDAEDMAAQLAALRSTATALEPSGLRSKLLIPNDQIKYMTIDTAGLSDQARREQAEVALDGATPYAVEDLVFDISNDGPRTHIAAVARETLTEAEAFATEHRFHPVSFAAQSDDHDFTGEAFFGPTDSAPKWLEPGDSVERDKGPFVILGDVELPPADTLPPKGDTAAEAENPGKADDVTADASQEGDSTSDAPAADAATPEAKTADAPQPASQKPAGAPAPKAAKLDAPRVAPASPSVTPPPSKASPPARAKTPEASAGKASAPAVQKPAAPSVEKNAAATPKPAPAVSKAPPAAPAATKAPADFSSRRSAPIVTGAAARGSVQPLSHTGGPVPDSSSLTGAKHTQPAKSSPFGFLKRRKPRATPPPPKPIAAKAAPIPGKALATGASEVDQMTVFGARKEQSIGGKPRFLGLVLTAALLVFLAGVAAWASVFLDDGLALSRLFGGRDTTQTASAPPPEPVVKQQVESREDPIVPQAPPETTADTTVAALDPTLSDEDGAVLDAMRVPQQLQPRELTAQEIEAKYATTGIWAIAPKTPKAPSMVTLDDLFMTSIDPVSTSNDAVALPTLASFGGDTVDISSAPPAAAGTSFTLDDRGLVVPSPNGTLNADGVLVFAGQPARVPPATLARPGAVEEEEVEDTVVAALLGFRPKLRPEDLPEQNERANLGGVTRNELAAFRPTLRSADVIKAAAAAKQAEVDAAAEAAAAAIKAALPQEPVNNATQYATEVSKRPDTRPGNFSRIVRRAERAQPAPVTVASAPAAVTPQVVQPSVPSKASVSKQATVKNAIKLRQINLIGVYGKPSSRRALIRLSNGRYQKVAVGDRLDGGRVSAIGEAELRYNRRGRDVVLKMPRG